MWDAAVSCQDFHLVKKATVRRDPALCADCHDEDYPDMVSEYRTEIEFYLNKLPNKYKAQVNWLNHESSLGGYNPQAIIDYLKGLVRTSGRFCGLINEKEKIVTDTAQAPDNANEDKLSRRTLLARLLGIGTIGWLGAITYPIAKYLTPPPVGEVKVTSMIVGMLDDVWEKPFRIIQFGRKPLIFLKNPQGTYRALSATCTHLACIVQYQPSENVIGCACHNGKFDLTGKVVGGPAPASLEEYKVDITDSGEIWVSQKQV